MIEPPIDLARHDKIVLVQPLDLLGAQRDGRVAPAEADIGMVAFCLSQVAHVSNKLERFLKITEGERPLDAVAFIAQIPIRSLRLKTLRFLMRERRGAAATGDAFLLGERLGHALALFVLPYHLEATLVGANDIAARSFRPAHLLWTDLTMAAVVCRGCSSMTQ